MQQSFDDITPKVTSILSTLKDVANNHRAFSSQLNVLEKDTTSAVESIKSLESTAKEWESKEQECTAYAKEIIIKTNFNDSISKKRFT